MRKILDVNLVRFKTEYKMWGGILRRLWRIFALFFYFKAVVKIYIKKYFVVWKYFRETKSYDFHIYNCRLKSWNISTKYYNVFTFKNMRHLSSAKIVIRYNLEKISFSYFLTIRQKYHNLYSSLFCLLSVVDLQLQLGFVFYIHIWCLCLPY